MVFIFRKVAIYSENLDKASLLEIQIYDELNLEAPIFNTLTSLENELEKFYEDYLAFVFFGDFNEIKKEMDSSKIGESQRIQPIISIIPEFNVHKELNEVDKLEFTLAEEGVEIQLLKILKEIIKANNLGDYIKEDFSLTGERYISTRLENLLENEFADDDYFIKIGDKKFLKVANKGESYDKEVVLRYSKKNNGQIYQKEEDFKKRVKKRLSKLEAHFNKKELKKTEQINLQIKGVEQIQDIVASIGISNETVEITNTIVSMIRDNLKINVSLKKLLNEILKGNTPCSRRILLINYLLGETSKKLSWITPESLRKLIFASLFCDSSFSASDYKLAFVIEEQEEAFSSLNYYDQKKIKSHPKVSTKILQQSNQLLTDELNIIEHHHEIPNGKGFPNKLSYKNTPVITCFFILIYNYSTKLIEILERSKNSRVNYLKILESMDPSFRKGNYSNSYQALKEILIRSSEN